MQKNDPIIDGLLNAMEALSKSEHEKAQIELYYRDLLTLQIFKVSEVRNWSLKLPFKFENEFIVAFVFQRKWFKKNFHKAFKKLEESNEFFLVNYKKARVKMYYKELNSNKSNKEIVEYLHTTLFKFCPADGKSPVDVFLREYD